MKLLNIKTLIVASVLLLGSTISIQSCKKETITTPTPSNYQAAGTPTSVDKYESYIKPICQSNTGMCGVDFTSMEAYEKFIPGQDEMKGMSYAKNLGNGKTEFIYYMTEVNFSAKSFDEVIIGKQFRFDTLNSIRQSLLNATYKNAGIKNIPTEEDMMIQKGMYPVDVEQGISTQQNNNFIVICKFTHDMNNRKGSKFSCQIKKRN